MTLPQPFRVSFRVAGNPVPKQSFRFRRKGKHFQPKRVVEYQERVGWEAKQAMQDKEPFRGEVSVSYVFKRGDRRRCDYTNMAKMLDDALNGIVFEDDSQITAAHVYVERGVSEPEAVILVESL